MIHVDCHLKQRLILEFIKKETKSVSLSVAQSEEKV